MVSMNISIIIIRMEFCNIKSHILRTNIIQNLVLVFPQTFDNVVIGGKLLDSQDHFITNEFVYNLKFVG